MCQHIEKVFDVISMCFVPVRIKYENNCKQTTIYSVFDNCSRDPFFHEAVLKQPEIKGIKTNLNL